MWRWMLLWALAAGILAPSAHAQREEGWRAPAGCPSPSSNRAWLRQHPSAIEALWEGLVDVHIDRAPNGDWRARLSLRLGDAPETRELRGADCASLSEAALLVLELAVDGAAELRARAANAHSPQSAPAAAREPDAKGEAAPAQSADTVASQRATPEAGSTNPSAYASPARRARAPDATADRPDTEPHSAWGALLDLGIDAGPAPKAALGLSGGLSWQHGKLWLDVRTRHLFARTIELSSDGQARVHIRQTTAAVHVCALPRLGPGARLGPCASAEVGKQHGRGDGLNGSGRRGGPFSALWLGAQAAWPGRCSAGIEPVLRLDVGAVLASPVFEVAGTQVHRSARWAVRAAVGVFWGRRTR